MHPEPQPTTVQLKMKLREKVEDDARVSRAIRRALSAVPDLSTRSRLCKKYTPDGVGAWRTQYGKDVSVFAVEDEATQDFVAVSALRELPREEVEAKYALPSNRKVAEVGMIYADHDCQGMSIISWPLEAVLAEASAWKVNDLVLEATEGASGMYQSKYGFAFLPTDGADRWPRKMRRELRAPEA